MSCNNVTPTYTDVGYYYVTLWQRCSRMCKSPRTQIHLCEHVHNDVVVLLTYVGNAVQQCRTMYENTTMMCDVTLHCYMNGYQLSWMCIIVWHCCNHVHSHLTMLQHCYATVLQQCCIIAKVCTTMITNV